MSRYLVTISWIDPDQPLRYLKDNVTVDLDEETLVDKEPYEIYHNIKEQSPLRAKYRHEDFTIDFMMKLGD